MSHTEPLHALKSSTVSPLGSQAVSNLVGGPIDNPPPTVTGHTLEIHINAPPSGTVSGPTIPVQGMALYTEMYSDGSSKDKPERIDRVEVRLGNAGAFVQADPQGPPLKRWESWSHTFTTTLTGQMAITAKVFVKTGTQEESQQDSVTVTVEDKTGPDLNITSPKLPDGATVVTIPFIDNQVTTVNVTGTATDSQTGVAIVESDIDNQNQFKPVTPHAPNDWSTWSVAINLTTAGAHTVAIRAKDQANNLAAHLLNLEAARPFAPKDPLDAFSPVVYLDDLCTFATDRVKTSSSGQALSRLLLKDTFHQPFDALGASAPAQQPVHQVRLCLEVLRDYLKKNNRTPPPAIEASYCQAAYDTLLRTLGTSATEIRSARAADKETRTALANRLGIQLSPIRPDQLDRLMLPPDQITETDLERLFGLVDTTRDPSQIVQNAASEPELLRWQRLRLHTLWRQQDDAQQSDVGTPVLIIDPDLLIQSDFHDPIPGNTAYDLWQQRQQWVTARLAEVKTTREAAMNKPGATLLAGFDAVVGSVLGSVTDLVDLADTYKHGQNITPTLTAKLLSLPAFLRLMRIRDLAAAGTVLEVEWTDVYSILVQVKKLRQATLDQPGSWRAEEQQKDLALEPKYFALPAADTASAQSPVALPQWRATPQARQKWQATLAARINQEQAVMQALQSAVEATEEFTFPALRDDLLKTLVNPKDHTLDTLEKIADRLSQELAIDFASSGNQKTTRLEQAIQTLQTVLFALRTGRLALIAPVVGKNSPTATWVLNPTGNYNEAQFDQEWQWMGAYTTWRAIMFVFAYPENLLLPSLAPKQTQAFTTFVQNLRANPHLTPTQARAEAKTYLDNLRKNNDTASQLPPELKDPPPPKQNLFEITEQLSGTAFGQRRQFIADLYSRLNITMLSQEPNYLKESFYLVPMLLALQLQKAGEYVAALDWFQTVYAYNLPVDPTGKDTPSDQRKIYCGLKLEKQPSGPVLRPPDWLLKGLNPHEIATGRANAYTHFTIMSLVRCFLEFADWEFTRYGSDAPKLASFRFLG